MVMLLMMLVRLLFMMLVGLRCGDWNLPIASCWPPVCAAMPLQQMQEHWHSDDWGKGGRLKMGGEALYFSINQAELVC